jgi:hypothetical protein
MNDGGRPDPKAVRFSFVSSIRTESAMLASADGVNRDPQGSGMGMRRPSGGDWLYCGRLLVVCRHPRLVADSRADPPRTAAELVKHERYAPEMVYRGFIQPESGSHLSGFRWRLGHDAAPRLPLLTS